MQSARDFLKAEANKHLADATAISDHASDEGRGMTPDERTEAEGLIGKAQQINTRVKDMDDNDKIRQSIDDMNGAFNTPATPAPAGAKSIGDAFVKSDAYAGLKNSMQAGKLTGKWTTGAIELPDVGAKATVTEVLSPVIQPSVYPGIQQAAAVALRQLTVNDLIAQGTTDSNTVRYLLETTNVNAAAATAESAAKPESTITFTQVDEPVRKVATFLPVSEEMLEDVAQIRSYLDNRLRMFVQQAVEAQLLVGSGAGVNIRGIVNRVGIQTGTRSALGVTLGEVAGTTTIANAVYAAITAIRVNAIVEPDGIVMHPTNWAQARTAKDTAGQYLGGGPMIGAYGNGLMASESYWGLPVAVTSAMTLNTILVGAFRTMAQAFYRGGLTVEASNSHADFFQLNQVAIRAEQRLALAVYRPSAFHLVTAAQTP